MAPFYELETSSPVAILQPNKTITHTQCTFHFERGRGILNSIANLGVSLYEIKMYLKISK